MTVRTDTRITSIDDLLEQGFQAVLVAVGVGRGVKLKIPGADHTSVLVGLDFLRRINLGETLEIGPKVLVLGGGNVAFDCARVARRMGARQVSMACLECRTDMPAACDEIDQGEDEGSQYCPAKPLHVSSMPTANCKESNFSMSNRSASMASAVRKSTPWKAPSRLLRPIR